MRTCGVHQVIYKVFVIINVKLPRCLGIIRQVPMLVVSYGKVCEDLDFASTREEVQ